MEIGGNATEVSDMIEEFVQGNFIKVISDHIDCFILSLERPFY